MIHLATVPLFCSTTCRKPNCSFQVKKKVLPSQKTVNLEGIQLNVSEGWKLPDKKWRYDDIRIIILFPVCLLWTRINSHSFWQRVMKWPSVGENLENCCSSAYQIIFLKQNQSSNIGQSEQGKISQGTNKNSRQKRANCLKRGKTRVIKSRLVHVLR